MTLHLEAVRGQATWWMWMIRDPAGTLVEESAIQFRSAEAAEAHGRSRLAAFEDDRRQLRPGARTRGDVDPDVTT
jgi:hypothetical protein